MSKKNALILLILGALILIAGAAAVLMPRETAADGPYVVITVDGSEYARVPLSSPQTVTVTQESGETNVIEISETGAVMASSTCKNQLCVEMGEVTLDNWEWRANQQFIICLPNRVSVELVVDE